MATTILVSSALQIQYDNACEDQLENAVSGLYNAVLHELFPRDTYIITGQYYFPRTAGRQPLYADYIVERIWSTGQRAIVLAVEAKPEHQTERQDTHADDQA